MNTRELYLSVDIETDGPCPGMNNMIALGAVLFDYNGIYLDSFEVNIEERPGLKSDGDTLNWWNKEENKEAKEYISYNRKHSKQAINEFIDWLSFYSSRFPTVVVGYPITFDMPFIEWYVNTLAPFKPYLKHGAIDIKTMIMMKIPSLTYKESRLGLIENRIPKGIKIEGIKHTPLADALYQGKVFFWLRDEL